MLDGFGEPGNDSRFSVYFSQNQQAMQTQIAISRKASRAISVNRDTVAIIIAAIATAAAVIACGLDKDIIMYLSGTIALAAIYSAERGYKGHRRR